ncbi:MAG TPA: hypothetical protein VI815_03010 [Candidatus Nanoarchaeia archaeon]|nr:hypothetical protein [Candidatus Nanoarchaeia archaeon]
MNVKIRIPGDERFDLISVPVEAATVIANGDLVSYESGYAVKLDAEAEDATFVGVCERGSNLNETTPITVWRKAIVEATVDSAAFAIGDGISLSAGGTLEKAGDNILMHCFESSVGVSVTTVKAVIDVQSLGKLFATNATVGLCGPAGLCGPIGLCGPEGLCGPIGLCGPEGLCGPIGLCGPGI